MAIINAELNVKKNSTEYDQLHLTSDASLIEYTSSTQGKNTITNSKLALDSLLRGDYISLDDGANIITYATTVQENKTCQVIKIINSTSVPENYGYVTNNNEFLFISMKTDVNKIRFIGIDCKTSNTFSLNRDVGINGVWTRVNDGGNSDTVDNMHAWQWLSLQSTGAPYLDTWLENKWDGQRYVIQGKNTSGTTYPTQVNNAETVDGYHANPAIGTPALKQIYAGTSDMVAGTTNLAQGTVYFVYE